MRWFERYEVPAEPPELEALKVRQAAAELAEGKEFRKMQLHRAAYDTRPDAKQAVLEELKEELGDTDDMMRRALGG